SAGVAAARHRVQRSARTAPANTPGRGKERVAEGWRSEYSCPFLNPCLRPFCSVLTEPAWLSGAQSGAAAVSGRPCRRSLPPPSPATPDSRAAKPLQAAAQGHGPCAPTQGLQESAARAGKASPRLCGLKTGRKTRRAAHCGWTGPREPAILSSISLI